jgi:hypothetical protein
MVAGLVVCFGCAEQTCGGFEESLTAGCGLFGGGGLFVEVIQVCETEPAANGVEVEVNIVSLIGSESLEEESAEFGAAGAAESAALPDFADGVASLIAEANECGGALSERWVITELRFDLGEAIGRELFIQPGGEFAVCPVRFLFHGWLDGRCLEKLGAVVGDEFSGKCSGLSAILREKQPRSRMGSAVGCCFPVWSEIRWCL